MVIEQLNKQLEQFPSFNCICTVNSEEEAINQMIENIPDIIFLDTELKSGTKPHNLILELKQYIDFSSKIIITSPNTDYSYQAIKNNFYDYLLTPTNPFELKKTLLKFLRNQPEPNTICLKSYSEFRYLNNDEILYLKADNNTTDFHLKNGHVITGYNSLKQYEDELPSQFVRIHKSYMVNIRHITKIHFSKFQCSLNHSSKSIPFSKSLRSTLNLIKENWLFESQANTILNFK